MKKFIESVKSLYNLVIKFITVDIWSLNINDFSRARRRLIRYAKVALITIKEAGTNKLGLYSVSLSFFSALAIVPFAAVAFAITGGFGLKERLQGLLLEYFTENKKFIELIIGFAENIVESSQKGLFGIISFLFFLWTVIWLILNIEKCFNEIWKVERARSLAKRFLYYGGILIIAPFLITIFLSVSLVFNNAFSSVGNGLKHFESISFVVQWLMFYGIILLMFTIMYKFIPAIKVNFSAAFWAASITALAFIVVQYLYMETQLMVTRLNSVYGAFAAIPLFLIWMNVSWTIILIGAEVSHAYQYESTYSSGNYEYLKKQVKRKILSNENEENGK